MQGNGFGRSGVTAGLVWQGMLIALAAVGGMIKLPAIVGSVALDSLPGYFAALSIGPGPGAIVAAFGHLASALVAGFPLTLPFHLLVAVVMAAIGASTAVVRRAAGIWGAVAWAVLTNGVAAPFLLSLVPNPLGRSLFAVMLVPLVAASAINVGLAAAAHAALRRAKVL